MRTDIGERGIPIKDAAGMVIVNRGIKRRITSDERKERAGVRKF